MPKRIQLGRRKGWRMPQNTVKVDRSTVWGNPFRVAPGFPARLAVRAFRTWLADDATDLCPSRRKVILGRLPELKGRDLACWCAEGEPCHADVLLELANAE